MKMLTIIASIVSSVVFAEAPSVQSGDVVQIGDFQYVVISTSEFGRMKLMMDEMKARWDKMNDNETGRVALHGKRGHTTITNGTIQVEYADGYKRIETIKENATENAKKPTTPRQETRRHFAGKRHEEIVKRRKEALSKTNEVVEVVR